MNLRILFCIGMGVFVVHIGVFMLLSHFTAQPHYSLPPKPNFSATASVVVDPRTGEKTTYREITVSTRFVPRPSTPPPAKPHLEASIVP
jgi:hypothetical protein